jgi:hypothetical protein
LTILLLGFSNVSIAFDAVKFNVEMDPDVKMITQERAYTSPIWYTP